uniref:Unclassified n=1 Tax=Hymenolepis diminuta TaxID=6216 RepID=A0A0R3SNV1_HYMDI
LSPLWSKPADIKSLAPWSLGAPLLECVRQYYPVSKGRPVSPICVSHPSSPHQLPSVRSVGQ